MAQVTRLDSPFVRLVLAFCFAFQESRGASVERSGLAVKATGRIVRRVRLPELGESPHTSDEEGKFLATPPELQIHRFADLQANVAHPPKYSGIDLLHLPKAGGNFVSSILNALFKPEHPQQGPWLEHKPGEQDPRPRFRIALIRDPCSYYLSVWSFQQMGHKSGEPMGAGNHGSFPKKCVETEHVDELYGNGAPQTFARWVKYISPAFETKSGLLGTRMLGLLDMERGVQKDTKLLTCPQQVSETEFIAQESELKSINVSTDAECWLDTSRLDTDLFRCLLRYAELQGDLQLSQKISHAGLDAFVPNTNKGGHIQCAQYFDEDLKKTVMSRETAYANVFGYTECCAARVDSIIA